MGKTLAERFEEKVARGAGGIPPHRPDLGPCDLWLASLTGGYGQISVDGRPVLAHRVAFFLAEGRWPEPCCLHHCDNPRCVRRSHLFEGTKADNIADMDAKGRARRDTTVARSMPSYQSAKTHCPNGHPYAGENLIVHAGRRHCRACGVERVRQRRERSPQVDPSRAKTHCKQGHPMSGDNLAVSTIGERSCRTCGRERQRSYAERKASK